MQTLEQIQYRVVATESASGESATLRAYELVTPQEVAAGTVPREQNLGRTKRNEHGLWPSQTPLGTRYYSNPLPVGYDKLIFEGYRERWGWETQEVIRERDLESFRRRKHVEDGR